MRRINFPFLAIFLLVVLVLCGAVHLLHGYQLRRNARIFLQEARSAKEAKNLGAAIQHYRAYLELAPEDMEALAEYGLLLADARAWGVAYGTMERLLRTERHRADIRRRLVDVAMALERFRDAREHLLFHLLRSTPEDPDLLEKLGQCEAALGNTSEAIQVFRKLVSLAPDRLSAYVQLAEQYQRANEHDLADECMANLVRNNPKNSAAYVLRGEFLRARNRLDEARQNADQALKLNSTNLAALLLAAESARQQEKYDEARVFVQKAIEIAPDETRAYTALANIEVAAGRLDEAIKTLQAAVERAPKNQDLQWNLANLYVEAGEIEKAESILAGLAQARFSQGMLDYLRGRIEYSRQQWRVARALLRKARAAMTAQPEYLKYVDFWLGACEAHLGNRDEQLLAYRRAIAADPFWIPARLGAASALASLGRTDEAIEECRQASALGGLTRDALTQLASLLIVRTLGLPPSSRDWSQVETALTALEKAEPEGWRAPLLRAEMLVGQGQMQQAEQLLLECQTRIPQELEIRLALAALLRRYQQWERAAQILDQTENDLGDSIRLRLARGQYLVERLGNAAAAELRKLADGVETLNRDELSHLWVGLGVLFLQVGELAEAQQLCAKAAELEPHNLRVRLLLFDLALRSRDRSGLSKVLGEIEQIEGRGALWNYGKAVELLVSATEETESNEQLVEAQSMLAQAAALRPTWSRVPLLSAEIADRLNDEERALSYYLRAFELGEESPRAIRRLLQLLYERERFVEAERVIRRLEEVRGPFSSDLVRLASEIYLRLEEFDRALELARESARISHDYRDHIWLGQVLGILGMRAKAAGQVAAGESFLQEAEKEFRIAVTTGEQNVAPWIAFVQFLARVGRKESAEAVLREAQERLSEGLAPVALAQCYEILGHLEEAEANYEEALRRTPENVTLIRSAAEFYLRIGKASRAEAELAKIVEGQVASQPEDLKWARRAVALVYADRGGFANLGAALRMLEPNLQGPDVSVFDRRAHALLLARHPRRKMREQALTILEEVVDKPGISDPRDRLVLAQLYIAAGQLQKAATQLRALLIAQSQVASHVAAYIRVLLNQADIHEAELWMRRLESLAPHEHITVDLRAEILTRKGQVSQAVAEVERYLEAENSQPADQQARLGLAAATLMRLSVDLGASGAAEAAEQLSQRAEAFARDFWAKAPKERQSNAAMVLAAFLAQRGKLDESLEIIESSWRESDGDLLMLALSAASPKVQVGTPAAERVWTILTTALEAHQRSTKFLALAAEVAFLQQRYAECESFYREILRKDSQHVTALNNLAILLVLQKRGHEEAKKLIHEALAIAGPVPTLLDSQSLVLLAEGKPQEALRQIEQAIQDDPRPELYLRRAQILHEMRALAAARQDFVTAEKLGLRFETLPPPDRKVYRELKLALDAGVTESASVN